MYFCHLHITYFSIPDLKTNDAGLYKCTARMGSVVAVGYVKLVVSTGKQRLLISRHRFDGEITCSLKTTMNERVFSDG